MKNGFVAISFHWIFVGLAGAFIMLFFFSTIQQGVGVAEQSQGAQLLKDFETIFVSFATNERSETTVDKPKNTDILYSCELDQAVFSSLRMEGGRFEVGAQNDIIFAPAVMSGTELYAKTLPIMMPYNSGSALFLFDEQTIVYLLYDNPTEEAQYEILVELLPENINMKIIDITTQTLQNEIVDGFEKHVVITINDDLTGNVDFPARSTAFGVNIVPNFAINNSGDITSYTYDGTTFSEDQTTSYYGEVMLLGYLASQNPDMFACNMYKLWDRLSLVTNILDLRIEELRYATLDGTCDARYGTAQTEFDAYLSHLDATISFEPNVVIAQANLRDLFSSMNSLKDTNTGLITASCAPIY